jgi:hypothetical protein
MRTIVDRGISREVAPPERRNRKRPVVGGRDGVGHADVAVIAGDVMVGEFARASAGPLDAPAGAMGFGKPKSRTFTRRSVRTLMFAGVRSR